MTNESLNESNFIIWAAKHYDNPAAFDTAEFYDDLKRFKYVRRLLKSYSDGGELKERLILNHITVIFNVFGPEASRLLFFKLQGYWPQLKTLLDFLGLLPDSINRLGIAGKSVSTADIEYDPVVADALGKME